jgi:hypothetical protein
VTDEKKDEPDDDVSTLELLKYKAMLYGTMVKMPVMSLCCCCVFVGGYSRCSVWDLAGQTSRRHRIHKVPHQIKEETVWG